MTAEELKAQRAKWAEAKRRQVAAKKARAAAAQADAAATVAGDAHELPPGVRISPKRDVVTEAVEDEAFDPSVPSEEQQAEDNAELERHYAAKNNVVPLRPVAQPKPAAKPTKPAPAKSGKAAMADRARALILEGKTNAEVKAVLVAEFNLPEKHAYYPSWYRAQLVMKGTITKQWAREHSGCSKK